MHINLFGSSDQLGGNIADIIAQILHSKHDRMYIKYNRDHLREYHPYNQSYNSTIFMQTLFDIVDEHNKTIDVNDDTFETYIELASPGHFEIFSKALLKIQCDFFSYFKKNLYKEKFRKNFLERANAKGYDIPFDPKKTILVHLRLYDVRHRPDYDGRICADFFKNHIESGAFADEATNSELKINHPDTNCQAPLNFDKIQAVIDVYGAFSSSGIEGLDVKRLGGYAIEDLKAMGIEGPAKVTKYNLAKADAALQRTICLALAKVALADGHVADDEIIFFNDCLEIAGLTIDDLK